MLTIELDNVMITSIYKPPNKPFTCRNTATNKAQVFIGDFNNHNELWEYQHTIVDGEAVEQWAETNHLKLMHDTKQPKSFNSGRWKRSYNPDLCFVSECLSYNSKKITCAPILKSQHSPIGLLTPIVIASEIPFRRHFNFKKADWNSYSTQLDAGINNLVPTCDNYNKFTDIKKSPGTRPCGCRKNFIPRLNGEHLDLKPIKKPTTPIPSHR